MRALVTGMTPESAANAPLSAQRRRASRREEWGTHTHLAEALRRHCVPSRWWWTSLENKPLTPLSGFLQKRRGVRRGLPDVMVLLRREAGTLVIFIELKSPRGRVSRAQKQVRAELEPTGAVWAMARSVNAALQVLHLHGIPFARAWAPPKLAPWEGPFFDLTRNPVHPKVRAERREAKKLYLLRKQLRAREAAKLAQQRTDPRPTGATGDDIAA
jgi:hypothetical protein